MSPDGSDELKAWKHTTIGDYTVQAHPLATLTHIRSEGSDTELTMVGYILDPQRPEDSNEDILHALAKDASLESLSERLYPYTGRFVLIARVERSYYLFHDACGLRSVFYTYKNDKLFAASQPLLIGKQVPLEKGKQFTDYQNSSYKKQTIEHWMPAGCSLYESVKNLVPNHYLDVANRVQVRFWPVKRIGQVSMEEGVEKASELLAKTMIAYRTRFKLAVTTTAGNDSRAILSASKAIAGDVFFYTLKYRNLSPDSNEIKLPRKLLGNLGYQHHVIDCSQSIAPEFKTIYEKNTDMPHWNDWGLIAGGMRKDYPADHVSIKGNCAEVGRCFYYKQGLHPTVRSYEYILDLIPGWGKIPFVKARVAEWFEEMKPISKNYGYQVLDMFYWEHRMGSWQAQSQLESDLVYESGTPFNNRQLLDVILSVDPDERCKPGYPVFKEIMNHLWPETLSVPINPKSRFHYLIVMRNIIAARLGIGNRYN
ncbi:MAG: hypothetical protein KDD36_01680 [Flavobacteriales bacterium]|nr:hypothetical protein [Flavobacteriales bacterium]